MSKKEELVKKINAKKKKIEVFRVAMEIALKKLHDAESELTSMVYEVRKIKED